MVGSVSQQPKSNPSSNRNLDIALSATCKHAAGKDPLRWTFLPSNGVQRANSLEPAEYENELCKIKCVAMHRPTHEPWREATGDYPYGWHLCGRKRLWEIRVQMRLKQVPSSKLYFGIELADCEAAAATARQMKAVLIRAVQGVIGDFYYSDGEDPAQVDGEAEPSTFVMPLWAFDQFVASEAGEEPEITGDLSKVGFRRSDGLKAYVQELKSCVQNFSTDKVYTFCIWGVSQFLDCIRWEARGIFPGMTVNFSRFGLKPPLNIAIYDMPGDDNISWITPCLADEAQNGNAIPTALKILQVRTMLPLARAAYAAKPSSALSAKRSGILAGYRAFAAKKGIDWEGAAAALEDRQVWELERQAVRREVKMPDYYRECYEGPIHSYDTGNGCWKAAFDAPSAYLLVHLHHDPDCTPQEAFDKLHEEFDNLALAHLQGKEMLRCVDMGCGVGTSTFSTRRSLERAGFKGKVTGVDLSDYFITVAKHIQKDGPSLVHKRVKNRGSRGEAWQEREAEFSGAVALDFAHGDALNLADCGFGDESLDLVIISEVTHEMPKSTSCMLFKEAARVLAPGGVLGFLDINSAQILKDNSVGAIVDRIATSNEPYFADYLELDVAEALKEAGLEVVERTWPHRSKYPTLESCSLRIFVAKKPTAISIDTWKGAWALSRREDYESYLACAGVPKAAWEAATKDPDFHEYLVCKDSFFMDHRIPSRGVHLRFTGYLHDEWHAAPYKRPTSKEFEAEKVAAKDMMWKHRWVTFPTAFETTISEFLGVGKDMVLNREVLQPDVLKMTLSISESGTGKVLAGPSYVFFQRVAHELSQSVVKELRERFGTGRTRSLEWRLEALNKLGQLVEENVDRISEAQNVDKIMPSDIRGPSIMVKNAIAFYQKHLPDWMAASVRSETLPPFMQTEGTWEVIPEPKGVGLIIAPWNAPALLCILPLMGMLAAGNVCIIKPSEAAPATGRLMARLISRYFPERDVVVVEGGPETVQSLMEESVDHIMFTGGAEVAKRIMAQAAQHLTPLTLELGGKNPCYVDAADGENLAKYAAEIICTKLYFGGQFCQAHDYCLVHEQVFDDFVGKCEEIIQELGPRRAISMVSSAHAKKLNVMCTDLRNLARPALEETVEGAVPLTLFLDPPTDSAIMQREIFGPLLPILRVPGPAEAVAFVRERAQPLVVYCYSPDQEVADLFLSTSSGNLAINCGPQRMQSNFNVGFGGVGQSGFGHSIWGKACFDDFSHHKTVFKGKSFASSTWGPPKGSELSFRLSSEADFRQADPAEPEEAEENEEEAKEAALQLAEADAAEADEASAAASQLAADAREDAEETDEAEKAATCAASQLAGAAAAEADEAEEADGSESSGSSSETSESESDSEDSESEASEASDSKVGISCASPATDAGEDEGDVSCRQEEEDQEEGFASPASASQATEESSFERSELSATALWRNRILGRAAALPQLEKVAIHSPARTRQPQPSVPQYAARPSPAFKPKASSRMLELSGTDALVSLRFSAKELAREKLKMLQQHREAQMQSIEACSSLPHLREDGARARQLGLKQARNDKVKLKAMAKSQSLPSISRGCSLTAHAQRQAAQANLHGLPRAVDMR
ncbi:unnamed protein product [Effrenium voratum]|nr:unnamed protein product [Effrenium voratum]